MDAIYNPVTLPQPDLDPLTPPWQQQLLTAGDHLGTLQSYVDGAIASRTSQARADLARTGMAVTGEVTARLQAAQQELAGIQQTIEGEIASRLGDAMGRAANAGIDELAPAQVWSTVTGGGSTGIEPMAKVTFPGLPRPPSTPGQQCLVGPPPEGLYGGVGWMCAGTYQWYTYAADNTLLVAYWDPVAGTWSIDAPPGYTPPPPAGSSPPVATLPPPQIPVPPGPQPGDVFPPYDGVRDPACSYAGHYPGDSWNPVKNIWYPAGTVLPPDFVGYVIPPYPAGGDCRQCDMLLQNGQLGWTNKPGMTGCSGPSTPPTTTPPAPPAVTPPDDLKSVLQCICDAIKGKPATPAKCPPYKLYKGREGCYLQPADQSPKSTDDRILAEGEPATAWLSIVLKECGTKTPETPVERPPPPPILSAGCVDLPPATGLGFSSIVEAIETLLGSRLDEGRPDDIGSWLGRLIGGQAAVDAFRGLLREFAKTLLSPVDTLIRAVGCGGPNSAVVNVQLFVLDFISKYVGQAPPAAVRPLQQQRDYMCPTELLSPAEATAAWLSDTITHDQWLCYVRAAGSQPGPAERLRHGMRSKLTPGELNGLLHRDRITFFDYARRLREQGFTDDAIPEEIDSLTEQIPPLSDLLRMLVRDVADEGLVARFGMDDQFDVKWQGKLKQFGDWQHIHPEYAKLAWRAHWSLPSPTQLFTMLQRLRHTWIPDDQRVTEDDVRTALEQNDMLPYWVPKMMAISYRPLTRVDVRRAFEIGVLDREAVRRSYLDLGYDDPDAETLTQFAEKTLSNKFINSPLVRQFATFKLSRAQLESRLQKLGASPQDVQDAVDRGREMRKTWIKSTCNASVKKRFLAFELTSFQARQEVAANGSDTEDEDDLINAWNCERAARGKILPAETACRLYSEGLITITDLYQRFLAIGYSTFDAALMVKDCSQRNQEKIDLKQQRAMAKSAADSARNAKQTQAEARRQAALVKAQSKEAAEEQARLEKQAERLANLRTKQHQLEEQRAKFLMGTAVKIANRGEEDLATIYHSMRRAVYTSVPALWLDIQEAVDAAVIAGNQADVTTVLRWQQVWTSLATGEPLPPDTDIPPDPETPGDQSSPHDTPPPASDPGEETDSA